MPVLESFLDTTGVPRVKATVECEPEASIANRTEWSSGDAGVFSGRECVAGCAVLDGPVRELDLGGVPGMDLFEFEWVGLLSHARGVRGSLRALLEIGLPALTLAEKLTLVEDLRAQKASGQRSRPCC